jgi:hypothetical protein
MKSINFKDKIEKEIVETIQTNEGVHDAINNIVKDRFVEKETSDQRFDRLLEEIRVAREKSDERWKRNDQRWEKNDRRWEESKEQWKKNDQRWEESQKRWDENNRKWDESRETMG